MIYALLNGLIPIMVFIDLGQTFKLIGNLQDLQQLDCIAATKVSTK